MLKTYLYIPDQLNEDLVFLTKITSHSKAKYIRKAIEEKISRDKRRFRDNSTQSLFALAELGKKANFKGPKDSSVRIDELLWGIK